MDFQYINHAGFFPQSPIAWFFVLPINQFSSHSTNSSETTLILSTIMFTLILVSIHFSEQKKGKSPWLISVYPSLWILQESAYYLIKFHAFGKKTIALQKYFYELVPKVIPMLIITRIINIRLVKQIQLHSL